MLATTLLQLDPSLSTLSFVSVIFITRAILYLITVFVCEHFIWCLYAKIFLLLLYCTYTNHLPALIVKNL